MVTLFRHIRLSSTQIRLFAVRSFPQNRDMYLSSSLLINTDTFLNVPFTRLHPGTSIYRLSTSGFLFTHVQENKNIEKPSDFPIWSINPEKIETTRALNKTAPPNTSVEPPANEPKKDKDDNQNTKPSLWIRIKNEVVHYYHGFRLLGLEVRIASGICFRVLRGHELTWRERKQLVRTLADILRLVPFAVFIIVPFMELLLPLYLKFFPFMLPSTFKDKSTETNTIRAKLELVRLLQDTLAQTAGAIKSSSDAPTVAEFQEFIKKVQKSGEQAHAKDITRFSKLFEDRVTLDSLDIKQLRMLCKLLSLPTLGTSRILRFQIWMRVRQLKAEDKVMEFFDDAFLALE